MSLYLVAGVQRSEMMDLPVQAGRSPPLRRRRTREYIPSSHSKSRQSNSDLNNLDARTIEKALGGILDENMNALQQVNQKPIRSHSSEGTREKIKWWIAFWRTITYPQSRE